MVVAAAPKTKAIACMRTSLGENFQQSMVTGNKRISIEGENGQKYGALTRKKKGEDQKKDDNHPRRYLQPAKKKPHKIKT